MTPEQQRAAKALLRSSLSGALRPIGELARMFARRGHELALVGGPVRDAFLRRAHGDLDLTTDARPEQVLEITKDWADTTWPIGMKFGTVGLRKGRNHFEITTYRSEHYEPDSRKPDVQYETSLSADLSRRDFTVNAMAAKLPGLDLVDPFGGLADLRDRILRTPGRAVDSFSDDPLRILRAARFVAELGLTPTQEVTDAMAELAPRLDDRLGRADRGRTGEAAAGQQARRPVGGHRPAGADRRGRADPARGADDAARGGRASSA